MLPTILIAIAALVVLFAIFVSTRPSDFRISRTGRISAPPDVVFENVNDLHKWEAWSPWAKMDPNAKNTFAGPFAGPGSSMEWNGNKKVGAGRMTIVDSRPNERIQIKLEFFKPFKATNIAEFTFKPEGSQTSVTWTMSGKNNFMAKAVTMVMNCDKMIGGQFEQGLANLNSASRSPAKV
ncbi:MAG TPA: SRPBCC family protein [Verrucomicrobiae bacterium]|nr:SRPBCC family protein [Verrucomicrobiae bacterium]